MNIEHENNKHQHTICRSDLESLQMLEHVLHPKGLNIKILIIIGHLIEASRLMSYGDELLVVAILDTEHGQLEHTLCSLGSREQLLDKAVLNVNASERYFL
jgi:hypothetical protein